MALWTVHGDGRRLDNDEVVRPDERLSWPLTVGLGLQHLAAMAGATILVPALTGFPLSTTLLFSGVGTLLFLLITRNRVPSYLGPSYAFVAPLVAAHAQGFAAQLGGVLFAGMLLAVIGVAVKALGIRLVDSVMPPVVTGAVIVLLALNLAPTATHEVAGGPLPAGVTLAVVGVCAVLSRGLHAAAERAGRGGGRLGGGRGHRQPRPGPCHRAGGGTVAGTAGAARTAVAALGDARPCCRPSSCSRRRAWATRRRSAPSPAATWTAAQVTP